MSGSVLVVHTYSEGELNMGWWGAWRGNAEKEREYDEGWNTFIEVRKAQMEWERAYLMFDEALGQDQIDYAIYILEAAERKYQIHLKHAKSLGLNWKQL
ncbi:hypothetical protein [Paenibacillus sp. NPDC058177]